MSANKFELAMGLEPYTGDARPIPLETTKVLAVTPRLPEYSLGVIMTRLGGAFKAVELDEREVSHEFIVAPNHDDDVHLSPDRMLRFTRKIIRQCVRSEDLEDVRILTSTPVVLYDAGDEVFDYFYEYDDELDEIEDEADYTKKIAA